MGIGEWGMGNGSSGGSGRQQRADAGAAPAGERGLSAWPPYQSRPSTARSTR